jgi:hypothetical protein
VLRAHDPHGYLDKDEGLQKAIADELMAQGHWAKSFLCGNRLTSSAIRTYVEQVVSKCGEIAAKKAR